MAFAKGEPGLWRIRLGLHTFRAQWCAPLLQLNSPRVSASVREQLGPELAWFLSQGDQDRSHRGPAHLSGISMHPIRMCAHCQVAAQKTGSSHRGMSAQPRRFHSTFEPSTPLRCTAN